ncbi:hypothetical protein J7S78_14110 [Klebsiella oxytoca]|uniref:Uncharacterized protein n=1 Tax=Klebsiella oxytoca TaxID=571 RepID=A0AAP2FLR3_KLEOX|nr:hypothetical protein [Klebsiella oxytoca]MBQ0600929.1 hypothetical protein [Klebsiella oxytoca]
MTPHRTYDYQPDECEAIASFEAKGVMRTCAELEALSNTAQQRLAECFQQNNSIPVGFTAIDFLNETERHNHHILRLSLTLCVDERKEAHARILARRESMKLRRQGALP